MGTDIDVKNRSLAVPISELTIYFNPAIFSNLAVGPTQPSGWNKPIAVPSDPAFLPDLSGYAFFDTVASNAGIPVGGSLTGFTALVDYSGSGTPGGQIFQIIDPATFATLDQGQTQLSGMKPVPEPGTLWLMGLGLAGALVFCRRRSCNLSVRATIVAVSLASVANAAPEVQGVHLISSVRSGRTTFDYTYALQVQVDSQSYSGASFAVTSSNAATEVLKGTLLLGDIDAGISFRTSTTFTIRQDRMVPFSLAALSFAFSGAPTGIDPSGSGLQVGTVDFYENGGRPGHTGVFPIQGNNPDARATYFLHVVVFGKVVGVDYSFLDATTGGVISTARLAQPPTGDTLPDFFGQVVVPSTPFKIAISASGPTGPSVKWESARTINPRSYSMLLQPTQSIVTLGQTVPMTIRLESSSASGAYSIALLLPPGFTAASGPWTYTLVPGQVINIQTMVTTTSVLTDYTPYVISAQANPVNNPTDVQLSSLDFMVE